MHARREHLRAVLHVPGPLMLGWLRLRCAELDEVLVWKRGLAPTEIEQLAR